MVITDILGRVSVRVIIYEAKLGSAPWFIYQADFTAPNIVFTGAAKEIIIDVGEFCLAQKALREGMFQPYCSAGADIAGYIVLRCFDEMAVKVTTQGCQAVDIPYQGCTVISGVNAFESSFILSGNVAAMDLGFYFSADIDVCSKFYAPAV